MVDASGNGIAPFAIENGQVKIVNARIQGANIDDLVVGTSNIIPGAVNVVAASSPGTGAGTTIVDLTLNHGLAADQAFWVKIDAKGVFAATANAPYSGSLQIIDLSSGSEVLLTTLPAQVGQVNDGIRTLVSPYAWSTTRRIPADRAVSVYRVRWTGNVSVGSTPEWREREASAFVFKQTS